MTGPTRVTEAHLDNLLDLMTGCATPGKIDRVPNQPKTPVTGIRIPLDLKVAVADKAAAEGTDLSKVVIRLLRQYVDPPKKRSRKSD